MAYALTTESHWGRGGETRGRTEEGRAEGLRGSLSQSQINLRGGVSRPCKGREGRRGLVLLAPHHEGCGGGSGEQGG